MKSVRDPYFDPKCGPLYLRKVRNNHVPDGTYWGAGLCNTVYCAFDPGTDTWLYVCAASRLYAQMILRELYGDLRFRREERL